MDHPFWNMNAQSSDKTLVASLCVGNDKRLRASQPFQKAYAEKYGHPYHLIDKERFRVRPNLLKKRRVGYHMEKFQLHGLLEDYERILFLDADVIPTVEAPDLLAEVPAGKWGCVREPRGENDAKLKEELERMAMRLGELPADSWKLYFNSGVMVFDRSHMPIWEWKPEEVFAGRWPEQTLLNYRILSSNTPVHELEDRYNYAPQRGPEWEDATIRRKAFFIHYAGQPAKAFMEQDLAFLRSQWGISG